MFIAIVGWVTTASLFARSGRVVLHKTLLLFQRCSHRTGRRCRCKVPMHHSLRPMRSSRSFTFPSVDFNNNKNNTLLLHLPQKHMTGPIITITKSKPHRAEVFFFSLINKYKQRIKSSLPIGVPAVSCWSQLWWHSKLDFRFFIWRWVPVGCNSSGCGRTSWFSEVQS